MSIKYRTSAGTSASNFTDLVVKVGDTLPIGTEVDYDGQSAPAGWQEVDDPNVYSTTETRIGTWIDGKPLYRKVLTFDSIDTNSNNKDIAISLSGHENIVNISGAIKTTFNAWKPLGTVYIDNNNAINTNYTFHVYSLTSTVMSISYGTWWRSNFSKGYVIVEYTKTTD